MTSRELFSALFLLFFSSNNLIAQETAILESSLELYTESYDESYPGYIFHFFDYAGDLNGDNYPDFTGRYVYPDLSTPELEDFKMSRFYYFGSENVDINPDVEFEQENTLGFYPLGDLNNDSFGDYFYNGTINFDLSGGDRTNIVSKAIELSIAVKKGKYEAGKDLNNDGFDDVILFHSNQGYNRPLEFEAIYGATDINAVKSVLDTVDVIAADQEQRLYRNASFTSKDLDSDNIPEILVYGYTDDSFNESEGDFLILKRNEHDQYEVSLRYNLTESIHGSAEQIYLGDYSAGGLTEVFLQSDDGYPTILELSYANNEFNVINEVELEDYQYQTIQSIGDFDGNGIEDFFVPGFASESVPNKVLFGTETFGEFSTDDIALESGVYLNGEPVIADLNQDGFNDFIIGYNRTSEGVPLYEEGLLATGFITFEGNAGKDLTIQSKEEILVPATENPLYTFHAGDFNDDGVEDYGVVFETSAQHSKESRVELTFGGESILNSDMAFKHSKGLKPSYPAVGDFNGDGVSDLAVNYEDSSAGLNIYFGGANTDETPDYTLNLSDLNPNNDISFEAFSMIENIADVNGDKIDDLLISTRYISPFFTKSFILFGGQNMSETPDLELSFNAVNSTALGDIDSDEKTEFLVFDGQSNGFIYEGFDQESGEVFDFEAEYIISVPSISGSSINQFGVSTEAGDFDADGVLDLAVKSAIHFEGGRVGFLGFIYEGAPAIYVYYGGEGFDNEYDQSFKIPLEYIRRFEYKDDETTSFSFNEFGELTSVPDMDGDGTTELMFATDQGGSLLTNALVFMGSKERETFGQQIGYMLEGKNRTLGLGSLNNYLTSYNTHSATGDFNNDGNIDFVLPQGADQNFKNDPVYIFSQEGNFVSNEPNKKLPDDFSLSQNYPNPFNPNTKISYKLPEGGEVKLEVFDISGRLIATIVDKRQIAGSYTQNFDASGLASGVYFYRLETASYTQTRKMLLIK